MADDPIPDRLFWPLAFLGLAAVRVPYLLSPGRILDGDEAILGLMAKHLADLSDFSVFFWGQSYGFSLLETLPSAVAFRIFGAGSIVLSLTMFCLFLWGIWLYEGGFRKLTGNRAWSRSLALGLGFLPVWIVWSFKARGGYLTAFLLGGLLLRLLTSKDFGWVRAAVVGGAASLLFFAQPLWLVAFLPLLGLPFVSRASPGKPGAGGREVAVLGMAALMVAAPLAYLSSLSRAYWVPDVVGSVSLARAAMIPRSLYQMFTGFFYMGDSWASPTPVVGAAILATALWFLVLLVLGAQAVGRRDPRSLLFLASLLGSVAGGFVLVESQPRYLLQASVLLVVSAAWWLGATPRPFSGLPKALGTAGILALAATATLVEPVGPIQLPPNAHREAELQGLVRGLEGREVAGAYSMDAMLQWQILFYGKEKIPVRFASPLDRRPEYPRQVDAALAAGRTVALVGTMSQAEPILDTDLGRLLEPVGKSYFVMVGVSRPLLESLGFSFLQDQ